MNTIEVIEQIQETAKKNQERPNSDKVKIVLGLKIGECYRQGDIYVFRVSDSHPVGEKLDRNQLADGFSIGQRHTLVGKFMVYKGVEAPVKISDLHKRACIGYAFDVLEPGCINTHPEHDHFKLMETGRYQVLHQVDLMTLQRVAD